MHCVRCASPVADNTKFCANCGEPIAQPAPVLTNVEWEYNLFALYWDRGKGGRWVLGFGTLEHDVRLDNWSSDQQWILPKLQVYLDAGWAPLTPVGPSNYNFSRETDYSLTGPNIPYLSVSSFLVELRRPARPRTEQELRLLGTWQDPNKGFLNALFKRKNAAGRWRMEFFKNKKFQEFDSSGEIYGNGIYYTTDEGEIQLIYKDWAGGRRNGTVTLDDNKLIVHRNDPDYRKQMEFERASQKSAI